MLEGGFGDVCSPYRAVEIRGEFGTCSRSEKVETEKVIVRFEQDI